MSAFLESPVFSDGNDGVIEYLRGRLNNLLKEHLLRNVPLCPSGERQRAETHDNEQNETGSYEDNCTDIAHGLSPSLTKRY